jgi:hypothetical protein
MANTSSPNLKLSLNEKTKLITPYAYDRLKEQISSVWLIITYLILFQLIVLRIPLVDALMIGTGISVVIIGLMFFMEGLVLGLMPFGETIGTLLPQKTGLPLILMFAFVVGMGATFAEPAIATLQLAGKSIDPNQTPLLYDLLNQYSWQLVVSVGIGVGIAVIFGVLRFLYDWSLKILIYPLVIVLAVLTIFAHFNEILHPIIGLAWDSGAVTTGPVTVPLVLALGIGVCRIVGTANSGSAGFGIVTLASLFPIIAVLTLGYFHYFTGDYAIKVLPAQHASSSSKTITEKKDLHGISKKEYEAFINTGQVPEDANLIFEGKKEFSDGKIIISDPQIMITKKEQVGLVGQNIRFWNPDLSIVDNLLLALIGAIRAILPLVIFFWLVLKFILKEKIAHADEIALGIGFALLGMMLFMSGINLALDPLGSQVGKNVAASFSSIEPYGFQTAIGPLFGEGFGGELVAILFAFVLGYSATLAEPALNALGATVEKITVGAFKKGLLMQTVAIGVGVGIALGIAKMIYDIPLTYLLIPPYLLLLFITFISKEDFVNFAWDSAGVTTGPITVPLVLAMGLGIGGAVGILDGFGVLAMASVSPILSVLIVGLMVGNQKSKAIEEPSAQLEKSVSA